MSIRDLKEKSRRALHDRLGSRAIYVDRDTRAETPCVVRLHEAGAATGDMAGFDFGPAEMLIETPRIVILTGTVIPTRAGVFSFSATEAYACETVKPPHGITTMVECTTMTPAQIAAAALPFPEGP